MPESVGRALRIHCTCGQKMKVSSSMYGLPGKCVACRLKIRIPREDAIPEGATDFHLKDHPKLIRKSAKRGKAEKETADAQKALDSVSNKPRTEGAPTPVTELDIAESAQVSHENVAGSRPLDPLESLQQITSLKLKIQRHLKALEKSGSKDKTSLAKLHSQLKRVKKARNGLDEHMRQLIMEVAIELTNTYEKISRAQISARVGEISFEEYQGTVYRLRHRRDRLERRQLNLRGWLAATDPFNVGGYINVNLKDIPEDGFTLPVPGDPEDSSNLLTAHAENLKQAFQLRKTAENKMNVLKRLGEASEGKEQARLADAYNTTKGIRRNVRAQITFYQQRLAELIQDYEGDLETLEAQLDVERDKVGMNELHRTEFEVIEQQFTRAKLDLAKGIDLAKRLVQANALDDVPEPRGTFLQRLGFGGSAVGNRTPIALWVAAGLWVVSIILPSIGDSSLFKAFLDFNSTSSSVAIVFALPIIAAIASIGISFVTKNAARGFSLIGLCAVTTLLFAFYVNEANFSLDPLANRFRSGTIWFVRPGMAAMLLANLFLLISAITTLSPNKIQLRYAIICGLFIAILAATVSTNGFGRHVPVPVIEDIQENFARQTSRLSGKLRISNEGSRTLHLVSRRTSAHNGFLYTIERKVGGSSFSGITPDGNDVGNLTSYADISLSPDAYTDIPYELPPGDYRLLLIPRPADENIEKAFSIVDPNPDARLSSFNTSPERETDENGAVIIRFDDPPGPRTTNPTRAPESTAQPVSDTPDSLLPAVELSGIITSADGIPHFSVELFTENEKKGRAMKVSLNDTLFDGWIITEFNSAQNTLTLQKASKFLILRRGERLSLNS